MPRSKLSKKRHIAFVEPFYGGSHRAFLDGWRSGSRHRITPVTLPAAHWKWRYRASSYALAEKLRALTPTPDVVVVSAVTDLAHLRHLSGDVGKRPFLAYFHENQFSYPRASGEPLDRSFATAHVATLAAADGVAINSRSHKKAFAESLTQFLEEIPAPRPRGIVKKLRSARVLYPGVDLAGFPEPAARPSSESPVIVWNHRWEEDKRSAAFARAMLTLAERGLSFRLCLLGTTVQEHPQPLRLLQSKLRKRIVHAGPTKRRRDYVRALASADIAISMAAQENFGYSVIEAAAAGAVPLLPARLSYPEILPLRAGWRERVLYRTDRSLIDRLTGWLRAPEAPDRLRPAVMRWAQTHRWERRLEALDQWVLEAS